MEQPGIHLMDGVLLGLLVSSLKDLLDLLARQIAQLLEVLVEQRNLPDTHLNVFLGALC